MDERHEEDQRRSAALTALSVALCRVLCAAPQRTCGPTPVTRRQIPALVGRLARSVDYQERVQTATTAEVAATTDGATDGPGCVALAQDMPAQAAPVVAKARYLAALYEAGNRAQPLAGQAR